MFEFQQMFKEELHKFDTISFRNQRRREYFYEASITLIPSVDNKANIIRELLSTLKMNIYEYMHDYIDIFMNIYTKSLANFCTQNSLTYENNMQKYIYPIIKWDYSRDIWLLGTEKPFNMIHNMDRLNKKNMIISISAKKHLTDFNSLSC